MIAANYDKFFSDPVECHWKLLKLAVNPLLETIDDVFRLENKRRTRLSFRRALPRTAEKIKNIRFALRRRLQRNGHQFRRSRHGFRAAVQTNEKISLRGGRAVSDDR